MVETLVMELPLAVEWYSKTKDGVTTISLEDNGNKCNRFILNLNNYRGADRIVLANSKKAYHLAIKQIIEDRELSGLFIGKKLACRFEYWHPNKRKVDVSNPVAIIEKYVFDALQECGVIEDDNCENLIRHDGWRWMGVDKETYPDGNCKLYLYEA